MAEEYCTPRITIYTLASKVLAVATPGGRGDWTVYCDAVAGEDHEAECDGVIRDGDKISKSIACVLFPQFDPKMYRE